jgi:hypothetical protein
MVECLLRIVGDGLQQIAGEFFSLFMRGVVIVGLVALVGTALLVAAKGTAITKG